MCWVLALVSYREKRHSPRMQLMRKLNLFGNKVGSAASWRRREGSHCSTIVALQFVEVASAPEWLQAKKALSLLSLSEFAPMGTLC